MIQNVLFGVVLDILIPEKNIQKELQKKIKKLLKILIMVRLTSLYEEMILIRLKKTTTSASMYFVTKMGWFFQNIFWIKNLRTQWI